MNRILLIAVLLITLVLTASADRRRLMSSFSLAGSPTPEILWWKFNEGTGTAVTSPAGTATSPTWATGLSGSGSCVDFNGTTSRVDTDSTLNIATNVATITFLANPDVTNATDYMLQLGTHGSVNTISIYCAAVHLSASLYGDTGFRGERLTGGLEIGVTHAYAIVLDGTSGTGDVKIYVDGVEQVTTTTTNTKSGTSNLTNATFRIGAHSGGSFLFDGKLDDVRVYNRILTDTEIANISADKQ